MKNFGWIGLVLLASFGCGGGGGDDDDNNADLKGTVVDMTATAGHDLTTMSTGDMISTPMLTVHNTLDWCTVTVTVGSGPSSMFSGASQVFSATAGTTVTLSATPNPSFFAVKWTGTTTMSGSSATYVMTGAASQSVTACCPTSAGGAGC